MCIEFISVIIPVYNAQSTIIESINSVVNECESIPFNWELILIDDGSTDSSVEYIQEYIQQSEYASSIRLITQANQGVAAARNRGMEIAKGTFIAFNDSDDRWLPGKMKEQMTFLMSHLEVDMVCGCHGIDKFPNYLKKMTDVTRITIQDMVFKNYCSPPTVVFRSKVLEKTGLFDEIMRNGGEETSLFFPMTYYCHCVLLNRKVAESISGKLHWGQSGLSGNLINMEKGRLRNLKMAYKKGYISFFLYCCAFFFSIVKFLRRECIQQCRKLKNRVRI